MADLTQMTTLNVCCGLQVIELCLLIVIVDVFRLYEIFIFFFNFDKLRQYYFPFQRSENYDKPWQKQFPEKKFPPNVQPVKVPFKGIHLIKISNVPV